MASGEGKQVALFVVQVLDQRAAVGGDGFDEVVTAVGAGRDLPCRQERHRTGKRLSYASVLSLHAGDDCGVHTSALVKQWPEELVLAVVMVRQTGLVPGQMPSEDSRPPGVAVGRSRNELAKQVRLATKSAMDDDHLMGVDHSL